MSSITETVETYAFYKIKANKGVKNGTNCVGTIKFARKSSFEQ